MAFRYELQLWAGCGSILPKVHRWNCLGRSGRLCTDAMLYPRPDSGRLCFVPRTSARPRMPPMTTSKPPITPIPPFVLTWLRRRASPSALSIGW